MSLVETLTRFVEDSIRINRGEVPFCETPPARPDKKAISVAQQVVGAEVSPVVNAALVSNNGSRPMLVTSHQDRSPHNIMIRHTPLAENQIAGLRAAKVSIYQAHPNGNK